MGWVSPTGFVDPDSDWSSEGNAYDEDTGTHASDNAHQKYLELTHSAIDCDKVRVYAARFKLGAYTDPNIDIDLFYDGGWHNIFSGSITKFTWVEKSNPAGTKSVTAMRVKFNTATYYARLREVDFWEEEVTTHEWEGSDGFAIGEALVKTPMKMFSDGIQFSDVLIKNPIKLFIDGIAFTDTWEGYKLLAKVLTDGIAIGEALVKSTSKVISDGIAFTDVAYKSFEKVLTDGIKIGEVLRKDIAKVLVDGIAFTDIVTKFFERVFTDGIKIGECLTHWRWVTAVRNLVRRRCPKPSIREQDSIDDGNI